MREILKVCTFLWPMRDQCFVSMIDLRFAVWGTTIIDEHMNINITRCIEISGPPIEWCCCWRRKRRGMLWLHLQQLSWDRNCLLLSNRARSKLLSRTDSSNTHGLLSSLLIVSTLGLWLREDRFLWLEIRTEGMKKPGRHRQCRQEGRWRTLQEGKARRRRDPSAWRDQPTNQPTRKGRKAESDDCNLQHLDCWIRNAGENCWSILLSIFLLNNVNERIPVLSMCN